MGIQARQIIRMAKKQGLTLGYGGTSRIGGGGKACALRVATNATEHGNAGMYGYFKETASAYNVKETDIRNLEIGFEMANPYHSAVWDSHYAYNPKNRYVKVGQNVAKLAGLTS